MILANIARLPPWLQIFLFNLDGFSLQKLMGHADLQILRLYLAQTTEDTARVHRMDSPVDNNRPKF